MSNVLSSIVLAIAAGAFASAAPSRDAQADEMSLLQKTGVYQLRTYEIFDRNKAAFHERFRDHAARIMQRYDFNIVAMWESSGDGKTEFIYLLQWRDESTMDRQWERFMADKEWSEIKDRTATDGKLVGNIQNRVMRLTTYSPSSP